MQLAAAANQLSSQTPSNNSSQTSTVASGVPASTSQNKQEQKTTGKVAIQMPNASNTVTVIQGNNLAMASHTSVPGNTTVSQVPVVQGCNLSNVRTYGQKLAMFQQRGTVVGTVSSSAAAAPLTGTTKLSTAGL